MASSRLKTVEEMMAMDDATRVRHMNEIARNRDTPEGRAQADALAQQILPIMHTPPHLLTPEMQLLREALIEGGQHYSCVTGRSQEELAPGRRRYRARHHRQDVHAALTDFPQLKPLQALADRIMDSFNDSDVLSTLDIPVLLDAIAKHLGRPTQFLRIEQSTPSVEEVIALLAAERIRRPDVHTELVKLAIRASMLQPPPHPRGCDCPLCAYVVGLTSSPSSSS